MKTADEYEQFVIESVNSILPQKHQRPIYSDTNFFELGLDSLQLASLEFLIRDRFPALNVPIGICYQVSGLGELVSRLHAIHRERLVPPSAVMKSLSKFQETPSLQQHQQRPHKVSGESPAVGDLPPLSYAQRRIWFACHANGKGGNFAEEFALLLTAKNAVNGACLKTERLVEALNTTVMANQTLRNVVSRGGDTQTLLSATEAYFGACFSSSAAEEKDAESAVLRLFEKDVIRIVDVPGEPCVRFAFVRKSAGEVLFLAKFHAIAADGRSIRLFLERFLTAYDDAQRHNGCQRRSDPEFFDFVRYERRMMSKGGVFDESVVYWKQKLRGWDYEAERLPMRAVNAPTSGTITTVGVWNGVVGTTEERARGIVDAVRVLAERSGATLFSTTVSLLRLLFYKMYGVRRLMIGVPVECRPSLPSGGDDAAAAANFARTLGVFLNLCVAYESVPHDATLIEFVRQNACGMREMLRHSWLPYDEVVATLRRQSRDTERRLNGGEPSGGGGRGAAADPELIQVAVIQDTSVDDDLFFSNIRLEHILLKKYGDEVSLRKRGAPFYPLMVHVVEERVTGALRFRVEFNTAHFGADFISIMFEKFTVMCECVAKAVSGAQLEQLRVAGVSLMTARDVDRHRRAYRANCTERVPLAVSPISAILAQLHRLPPSRVVVEDGYGRRLTADGLLQHVDHLSATLRQALFEAFGANAYGEQSPVALLHQRNANLIPLILACWAIGRPVLPISNDWPPEKVRETLAETLPLDVVLISDREQNLGLCRHEISARSLFDNTKWLIARPPARPLCAIAVRTPQKLSAEESALLLLAPSTPKASVVSTVSARSRLRTIVTAVAPTTNRLVRQRSNYRPDLLYLTFTSGSSGRPRVVMTECGGPMNLVHNYTTLFNYNADSVVCQAVSNAFDIFFADLLIALLNGARLLITRDAIPGADELSRATHAYVMPAYVSQLRDDDQMTLLSGLEVLQFGGEPICGAWLKRALDASVNAVQLFGFTEHSVYTTYKRFRRERYASLEELTEAKMCIGTAFRNTHYFAVDGDGQTLPADAVGAEGTLCSAGCGVARGYFLTANGAPQLRQFRYDSTLRVRYFVTGDRVRVESGGRLRFIGRNNEWSVKVRGNIVHILEVESLLGQYVPQIVRCACVAVTGGGAETPVGKLAAFVCVKDRRSIGESEWLQTVYRQLRRRCPLYMIPEVIKIVDRLPLTSNGKIDRQRLRADVVTATAGVTAPPATVGASQAADDHRAAEVCEIFASFMKLDGLGPDDNLFERGADSIQLLMAIQQIRDRLGVVLDLDGVFRHQTVRRVMHHADDSSTTWKRPDHVDAFSSRRPEKRRIPLSHNQEQIWLTERIHSGARRRQTSDVYVIPIVFTFNRAPDEGRLRHSINRLIQNNAVLRTLVAEERVVAAAAEDNTAAAEEKHEFCQVLLSATESFVLPFNASAAGSSAEFHINVAEEIPLKICSSAESVIVFLLHHFAVDGASLSLIAEQLASGYHAEGITSNGGEQDDDVTPKDNNNNNNNNNNTPSYAYAQFSVEQRSTDYRALLRYWSDELEAVKNAQLPVDFEPSSPDERDGASKIDAVEAEFALPRPSLRNFIAENSCTLTQLLLTAYLKAQSQLNAEDETAVVGIGFENRPPRYRDVIGFFSNVQAVPFSLRSADTPATLLRDVREKLLSAGRHANVPFPLVVRELRPRRSGCGRNPLFQRTFAVERTISGEFVDGETDRLHFGDDLVASVDEPRRANDAKFDQCWRLTQSEAKRRSPDAEEDEYPLKVIVEYNTRLLKRSTIEKHLDAFRHSVHWTLLGLDDRSRTTDRPIALPSTTTTTLDVIVEELRRIWRHVLDTSADVGVEENFFEIGGHSLLANRICSLVRQRLHIACDLFLLFQNQTIAELSAALYERLSSDGCPDDESQFFDDDAFSALYESAAAESARVPTCRLQDPLLRLYREANEGRADAAAVAAYTIPIRVRLSAGVRLKRLKACLKALLSLHPTLRTRFEADADGRFYQRTLSIRDPLFERRVFVGQWIDADISSPSSSSERSSDNDYAACFEPFKLPPLQLRIAAESRTLHMEFSHLLFDGASANVLMRDLHQLYYRCVTADGGEAVKMDVGAIRPPLYHDFSVRLNAEFAAAFDDVRQWWRSAVAGCPPENRLITSGARVAEDGRVDRRAETIALRAPNLNRQLGVACRAFRVSPLCVAMFAFGRLLRQRMALYDADFCVGTVVDVRDAECLHDAIGFFVNTVPIPFLVERLGAGVVGATELRNRMTDFQRLMDEAINRKRLAYDQILDATERDSLFDVMLVIDNSSGASTIGGSTTMDDADFRVLECRPTASKFDLTLFVRMEGADADVHVEFVPSLFVDVDAGFPRQLAIEWAALIRRLSAAVEAGAEPLRLMRENVIRGVGAADRPPPLGLFLLIDAQARRTPDHVALQTPGDTFNVSYAELIAILDRLADRLACRYFEATGRAIDADTLIGVMGRRSCVASVLLALAVLRSGAAYLPIDYEIWPASRVETILAEANVEFCVRLDEAEKTMTLGTAVHESCFLEAADEYLEIIERRGGGGKRVAAASLRKLRYDDGHDLAYVIFTSGTTSKPKGAALERRGVANMIVDATRRFYVDAADCVYQFTDFCFDNSVLEIFLALFNGARLFIDDECKWRRDLDSTSETASGNDEQRGWNSGDETTNDWPMRKRNGEVSAERRQKDEDSGSWESTQAITEDGVGVEENFVQQTTTTTTPTTTSEITMPEATEPTTTQMTTAPLPTTTNPKTTEITTPSITTEKPTTTAKITTPPTTKLPEAIATANRRKRTKGRASRYFCVQRFCRHIETHSITHAILFPALVETFEDAELRAFGSGIRYWISGAEKMPRALMERALRAGVHVAQSYGPTECTCFMLSRRMRVGDHPQNLGRPIGHMAVTVRTPDGDPAMPFAAHQLYVSGVGLTRGYLNRAADQQPFKDFDGVRYYATGDIVQIVDDDEILYVGRTDSQLKVRGFRVELSEIENALAALPGVRLAKAAASTAALSGPHIVAYVAADPTVTQEALRCHCRSRLPYYMIPRLFYVLDRFPVSANSKIDFKSLPQPDKLIRKASERGRAETVADKMEEPNENEVVVVDTLSRDEEENNPLFGGENFSIRATGSARPSSGRGDNLPQPVDAPDLCPTGHPPARAAENVLRTMFDVLHIADVDAAECRHLSFIQLGGNSLNAQRIINRLNAKRAALTVLPLDIGDLLRSKGSVVQLAAELAAKGAAEESERSEEATGDGAEAAADWRAGRTLDYTLIPLSRQQEQMWYLSHIDTKHLYTLPLVQRFSRAVNVRRLHAAFMHVVADHAVLRTIFHESADYDLYQRVLSLTESYYANVQSNGELPTFCADEMTRFAADALIAFDLHREPPLRCQLFREASPASGYVMVALIHHAACDAYSTALLESELARFYDETGKRQCESESAPDDGGRRPPMGEVAQKRRANAYALWALKQRSADVERRLNAEAEEFAAQFTATLDDALPPQVLFRAPDEVGGTNVAASAEVISAEFLIPVHKLKAGGVTAFNFVCAALLRTFSGWALRQQQPQERRPTALRIGSTTSNRRFARVESTIGNFLNNLVMTLPLDAASQNSNSAYAHAATTTTCTVAESIQRVARSMEAAMRFADVPFATLFAALRKRHADTVTRVEQLYSVYVNCRYDLEDEKSLAAMPEAVLDRRFTEELVSTLFGGGAKELEHFMEVVVDERATDDYTVRISVSTERVDVVCGRPPFSPDRKLVRRFIDAFRRECLVGADVCEMCVSERVTDAVRKVLSGVADAQVLRSLRGTDNFFALGGNSILLLKLRKRLEDALDAEVAVADLLNRSTIDDFVRFSERLVEAHLRSGAAAELESDYSGDDSDTNWSDYLALPPQQQQRPTATAARTKKVSFADETVVQTLVDNAAFSSDDEEQPQQHLIIVLFHALIAGNLSYTALCKALKRHHHDDRSLATTSLTVLGVQHPETFRALPARTHPTDSLRHLAEHYADCLKCYVGRPPSRIVFVGASLGATLAYECCEALKRHGYDVDAVISIDGNAEPTRERPTRDEHETAMRTAIAHRTDALRRTASTTLAGDDAAGGAPADSIDEQTLTHMTENAWNLLQLRLEHKFSEKSADASSTPTQMVLLKALEEELDEGHIDDYGWRRLNVNLIAVDTIAGSHATMLDAEHCGALARKILKYCRPGQTF